MIDPVSIITAASGIISLFTGKSDNELKSEQFKNELAKMLTDFVLQYEAMFVENLNKQIDVNKTLAEQGKLGWRSWLPAWLSGFFITGVGLYIATRLLAWLLILFGVDPTLLEEAAKQFPKDDIYALWPMIAALGGIYWVRGNEKNKALAMITGQTFNRDKFFSELRRALGGLTQAQVDALNKAINAAQK